MDTKTRIPVKCLLVDDLEDNLLALSALLGEDAVEVLTARSGAEALELLLIHDVALALLDVQMPDMDGFELAELMRGSERTRHIPLIFVTAGVRETSRVFKGYELGAVDFIYKPIEPHILKNKAAVFLQLYRQRQQIAHELSERTETLRLNEMFTALLAHDLRNPLSAILGTAHVLKRRVVDPNAQESATRIISSGTRMARMIEDMLDLTRARLGGGIAVKPERQDFKVIVERVVREQQAATPERQIEWRTLGDTVGACDGERFAQVTANLLGNAAHHGDTDRPLRVELDGTQRRCILLTVSNGGEVPEYIAAHLFDPFRGAERRTGRSQGLGLGLFIVKQLVTAHGGTVDFDTGQGVTSFHVSLPRHQISD